MTALHRASWALKGLQARVRPNARSAAPQQTPAERPSRQAWSEAHRQAWLHSLDESARASNAELQQAALNCRSTLRVADLATPRGAAALGLAAGAVHRALGWRAHEAQGLAAWLMLQGHLAEMATGEGKTLAAGLAAATAAMAGLSVHVMTANDYLVQRDADMLRPAFELLGLASAAIVTETPREVRHGMYRQAIVYVTARELVFDHLKDHLIQQGERDQRVLRARAMAFEDLADSGAQTTEQADVAQPLVPQLQQVLIDEADSILLDEANVPFIVSLPGPAPQRGVLDAARALASQLQPSDFVLHRPARTADLTEAGRAAVSRAVQPSSPLWPARQAVELVRAVLTAEHLLRRERDYTVRDGAVVLIDDTTGRLAVGRQWSHPLHAMVEIKEGLDATPPMRTAARITYQRLFPRYERLGGMSGTLKESAGELASLYRSRVVPVPRARPSQARWLGRRCFATRQARLLACVERAGIESRAGRPVLIGTDSVEASREVARGLTAAGLAHQVLNAVQDAQEAQQVACAGQAGRITVTTNMAGRGTDISLDAAARQAGGLHVILALSNRSRRIDRQLAGRAARQGDPGSAEALICLEDAPLAQALPARLRTALARWARARGELPPAVAEGLSQWSQRWSEWRERMHRRELRIADEQLAGQMGFAGRQE